MRQGESGYISSCASIVATRQAIETAIRDTLAPDLYVLGEPKVSVVAFASRNLNVYEVADAMSEMGWHLNALQDPPAVHIACTKLTGEAVQAFVTDLTEAVKVVKLKGEGENGAIEGSTGKGKGGAKKGDTAALYGVAGSLPYKSVVEDIAVGFIDTLYKA